MPDLRLHALTLAFAPSLALPACGSGAQAVQVPAVVDVPPPTTAAAAATVATVAPATPPPAGEAPPGHASPPAPGSPPPPPPPGLVSSRPDGLLITVLTPGGGPEARDGDHVRVHYVGTLQDGTVFDTSRKPGRTPFVFVLGKGTVIKGWEAGVVGMRVGELRRLVIPPDMAYGDKGRPPVIPPGSALVFDIELLGIDP